MTININSHGNTPEEDDNVNQNVTNDNSSDIIDNNTSAGAETPEETLERYQAMIDSLADQNRSLQTQIGLLIRNGASTSQPKNEPQNEPQNVKEPYVSLKDLGNELGKRDYKSHNMRDGD